MYYIYILTCADGSLYSGITTNLDRRLRQHRGELKGGAKYTRSHPPTGLAAAWTAPDRAAASRLEYRLHHMGRAEKEALFGKPVILESTGERFEPWTE